MDPPNKEQRMKTSVIVYEPAAMPSSLGWNALLTNSNRNSFLINRLSCFGVRAGTAPLCQGIFLTLLQQVTPRRADVTAD